MGSQTKRTRMMGRQEKTEEIVQGRQVEDIEASEESGDDFIRLSSKISTDILEEEVRR